MYIVHTAPVQLTFSNYPLRDTMFWTHAGAVQFTFVLHPVSPKKNVNYIFIGAGIWGLLLAHGFVAVK